MKFNSDKKQKKPKEKINWRIKANFYDLSFHLLQSKLKQIEGWKFKQITNTKEEVRPFQ